MCPDTFTSCACQSLFIPSSPNVLLLLQQQQQQQYEMQSDDL